MDFQRLLVPYAQGGTERDPVERTMGTITDYFINKKGYPIDIVGAAIFTIFLWLDAGNEFKGDKSYGSKGRELVTSIRMKCDELAQLKLESLTYQIFIEQFGIGLARYLNATIPQRIAMWFRREFTMYWNGAKTLEPWW